jgi:hypothetical protein
MGGCWAVGFPRFKKRPAASPGGPAIRDSAHVGGEIKTGSHLKTGLLELHVTATPRPMPPPCWLHRLPHRSPVVQQAPAAPGRQDQGPLPAPRSGLQVHRQLRRALPKRGRGGHPPALSIGRPWRIHLRRDGLHETARREVLDHLLIFGSRHLEDVLQEVIEHYEVARPHQGLGQHASAS